MVVECCVFHILNVLYMFKTSFVRIWKSAGMSLTSISLLPKFHFQVYESINYTNMKVLYPSWILLIETKSLIKMCKM
jgi:hypothetical protein